MPKGNKRGRPTSEDDLLLPRELFDELALDPLQWLAQAESHLAIAEDLFERLKNWRTDPPQMSQAALVVGANDAMHLFLALSIELYLKAVLVHRKVITFDSEGTMKGPGAGSHQLGNLANLCGFEVETKSLEPLSHYGVWASRYPVAKRHEASDWRVYFDFSATYVLAARKYKELALAAIEGDLTPYDKERFKGIRERGSPF